MPPLHWWPVEEWSFFLAVIGKNAPYIVSGKNVPFTLVVSGRMVLTLMVSGKNVPFTLVVIGKNAPYIDGQWE
ncbi:unnamed protein product, partial [Staurois parvus]